MSKKLSVIDFFCGGGGFSEGFRQAGFEVIWSVDLWQPAVDTHNENHPEGITIKDDVIRLSMLPDKEFHETIPDSEVIIGSPPCTAFSNSNKSGNGDKAKGIALIEAYLKIVARKKFKKGSILKYWILENVPKVKSHIKESYSAKDLGLEGRFELVVKGANSNEYNAKYYGVPSSRKRFFCGDFPEPEKIYHTDSELMNLNTITKSLGNPDEKKGQIIIDPIYNFSMKGDFVTDHHYLQELAEFEWKTAKRLKQDKGYMGKMSLPENGSKPARTIMATMSFSARESFILALNKDKFRAPTIREVASLMSFPIDYRFYGSSIGTKYKLVGNSVPPRMSFAFAKAINKNEGIRRIYSYSQIKHTNKIDFKNLNGDIFHINIEKPKKITSKFKYHIPYFIFNAYRVELTNHHSDFDKKKYKWSAEIHHSQGKKAKIFVPELSRLSLDRKFIEKVNRFLVSLKPMITTATAFQVVYCNTSEARSRNRLLGPYELLEKIKDFIQKNFDFSVENNKQELLSFPLPVVIGFYILKRSIETLKIN